MTEAATESWATHNKLYTAAAVTGAVNLADIIWNGVETGSHANLAGVVLTAGLAMTGAAVQNGLDRRVVGGMAAITTAGALWTGAVLVGEANSSDSSEQATDADAGVEVTIAAEDPTDTVAPVGTTVVTAAPVEAPATNPNVPEGFVCEINAPINSGDDSDRNIGSSVALQRYLWDVFEGDIVVDGNAGQQTGERVDQLQIRIEQREGIDGLVEQRWDAETCLHTPFGDGDQQTPPSGGWQAGMAYYVEHIAGQ